MTYDELVLAPGSISRTLPVPGLAEHGIGFKTVEEAIALRNHVLEQMDIASSTRDPELRDAALTYVFVGGGYAGVEALAELADMARYATRYYHNVKADDLKWILVEASDHILPEVGHDMGKYAVRELRARNIDVRLETRLDSCENRVAVLSDGTRFPTRTVVWTAGVKPHPILAATDLPLDKRGQAHLYGQAHRRRRRTRLVGRRRRGRPRPRGRRARRGMRPQRATRRPPGPRTRREHRRLPQRRDTARLPLPVRRFRRLARSPQGRRTGVRP